MRHIDPIKVEEALKAVWQNKRRYSIDIPDAIVVDDYIYELKEEDTGNITVVASYLNNNYNT